MEGDNNKIVIRLAGIIVCLVVVIILMVAAVVLFKINSDNKMKVDELNKYKDTLETEKQSLQGEVDKLNEKNKKLEDEVENWKEKVEQKAGKNYVKEVEFGFKEVEDSFEYYDTDISSIPEEDIKSVISDFMKMYAYMYDSNIKFLIDLGLTDVNRAENYKHVIDSYYETDIKFDDYKTLLLNCMTKECFNSEFCSDIKEKDGILYYSDYYTLDSASYEIKNIKKGEEENVYEVKLNYKYDGDEDECEYVVEIVQKDGKPLVNSVY